MPKKEMDYSKCLIYKIQHKDNNDLLYVGHTTNFTKRKYKHKSNISSNDKYNMKLYQMIRENGGWDDFNMIVIEEFPCKNLREAKAEEDKVMREMKSTMNTNRALKSLDAKYWYNKKYRELHQEQIKEHKHQYYEENKEKISKTRSQFVVCECGKSVSKRNFKRHEKSQFHINFLNPCINIDHPFSLQPEPASS